ncbi:MAG: hypothetical protein ACTSRU_07700 [Candidatus Hodarchaeales archaeon]
MKGKENLLSIEEAIVILNNNFTDIDPDIFWKSIRKKFNFTQPSELSEDKTKEVIQYLDDWGIRLLADDFGPYKAEEMCLDKTTGYVSFFNTF